MTTVPVHHSVFSFSLNTVMSVKAILVLCAQALLLKSALGQCASRAAVAASPYGLAAPALAAPWGLAAPACANEGLAYSGAGLAGRGLAFNGLTNSADVGYGAAYGGAGEGNAMVAGELSVAGTTGITGQVPIMGVVSYGGPVAAAGAVTISGQCACGCGAPFEYLY